MNDSAALFFVGYTISKTIDAEIAHFAVTWDKSCLSHQLWLRPDTVPVNLLNGTIQQRNAQVNLKVIMPSVVLAEVPRPP